jgi:hypothetical protein
MISFKIIPLKTSNIQMTIHSALSREFGSIFKNITKPEKQEFVHTQENKLVNLDNFVKWKRLDKEFQKLHKDMSKQVKEPIKKEEPSCGKIDHLPLSIMNNFYCEDCD